MYTFLPTAAFYCGDALEILRVLPDDYAQTCVTSPPYFGLRDYGHSQQIGTEPDLLGYLQQLTEVFSEVRRVLKPAGTLWLNLGDSYASSTIGSGGPGKQTTNRGSAMSKRKWAIPEGLKAKDLIGIPWRLAFALQESGWYLRQDIIWHKTNAMPEPVKDRCAKSHEYLFLLSKRPHYYFDVEVLKEPAVTSSGTRTKRSVWSFANDTTIGKAHFATFPEQLITPCILACSQPGDIVLDPFSGSGTTAKVATQHQRYAIGIELNPEYYQLGIDRLAASTQDLK